MLVDRKQVLHRVRSPGVWVYLLSLFNVLFIIIYYLVIILKLAVC